MGSIIAFIVSLLIIWKGGGYWTFFGYCGLIISAIFIMINIAGAIQQTNRQMAQDQQAAQRAEDERRAREAATQRPCPMCGEAILKTARKCKHCGEFIEPETSSVAHADPVPASARSSKPDVAEPTSAGAGVRQFAAAAPSSSGKPDTKITTGGFAILGLVGVLIAKVLGWI